MARERQTHVGGRAGSRNSGQSTRAPEEDSGPRKLRWELRTTGFPPLFYAVCSRSNLETCHGPRNSQRTHTVPTNELAEEACLTLAVVQMGPWPQ